MIPITKPFLPPKEEYQKYLQGIWKRNWLTNNGPLSQELESKLKERLIVDHLLFVSSGTIALQMAIKALGLSGEIITTPFSFVATTSSIVWEGCEPVFVDIDKESLNIDPSKIEAAITDKTSAILATHVYGNPCDVKAIEKIAQKHQLKVIYDGAHAFGVELYGKSIFDFGDISICSLHATKLYHSIEGGLVICKNKELYQKLKYMRNFGISGFDSFAELGVNGKNSEFHAAMGLVNLNYIDQIHSKRKEIINWYNEGLNEFSHQRQIWNIDATKNYAYYPIILESENQVLQVIDVLKENSVGSRRYFYPSLSTSLPYVDNLKLDNTDSLSRRILCLPIYYDLTFKDVKKITNYILTLQKNKNQ